MTAINGHAGAGTPGYHASPVVPGYHAAQRVTGPRVLRSEWTKLRSLPSAAWSLLIATVLTAGFGVLYSMVRVTRPPHGAAARAAFDPTSVSLSGVQLSQLAIAVLGVLLITGEFASGQVRVSFTAVPRRLPVLAGKAAVLAFATFALAAPAALAAFLAGQSVLSQGHLNTSLASPGTARAVIGSALYLTVVALLGLGLGALLRNTAAGVAATAAVLFAPQILVGLLAGGWAERITQYLPSPAGLDATIVRPDSPSLGPWAGLGLFCLYTAAVLAAAAWRTARQDA